MLERTTDRMPRVVYLGHTAALSGGEIGLSRLVEAMPGVTAHVILAEDGPLTERLRSAGATVEILELTKAVRHIRRGDLSTASVALNAARPAAEYARRVASRLRAIDPQLVHTNTLKAGFYGTLAARACGIPTIWGLHDAVDSASLPKAAIAATRFMAKTLPSALVVPSQATLSSLGPGFRPGLTRAVIPLPVVTPGPVRDARSEVSCIGLIGRLAPGKGQDVFLRAFAEAYPSGSMRAKVIGSAMFGEDAYADSLIPLCQELGIQDRVEFTGFRSDVPAELASLDIVVSASVLPETLGQTIIEAMAAGVPTISANSGGPSEYVKDGVNGLMHQPGNASSLARALLRLSEDPELRSRVRLSGRTTAEAFSAEEIVPRMSALYQRVATDQRPRRALGSTKDWAP